MLQVKVVQQGHFDSGIVTRRIILSPGAESGALPTGGCPAQGPLTLESSASVSNQRASLIITAVPSRV